MHACMTAVLLRTEEYCRRTSLATTDAGKNGVRVDFHLCYAEAKSTFWSNLSGQPLFKIETTVFLLDLVYFFWYEERQLLRGAKVLAKVLFPLMFVTCSLPSTAAVICMVAVILLNQEASPIFLF